MNWDQFKRDRDQFSRRLKERWPKLTSEDIATIAGSRRQLMVVLQRHYGYGNEWAETELYNFLNWLKS